MLNKLLTNPINLLLNEIGAKRTNHSFTLVFFSGIKNFPSVKITVNCRSPGDITHGLKIGNNYKHGKTVRYSCNAGFTLEGEAEVTCEEGTWNTDTPKCKGTVCKRALI